MKAIRGVIVDFGGVLALPPDDAALARLRALTAFDDAETFLASWRRHRLAYDLGNLSGEEYWRLVEADAARTDGPTSLAQLLAEDAACWSSANAPFADWLREVRDAGLGVALLSNMPREVWAALHGGLAWLALCDVVVLSCDVGLAKPDPRIFRHCLEQLELGPSEVVFVDDLADNVAAAAELGINAILFTSVEALARDLADFEGVPLP